MKIPLWTLFFLAAGAAASPTQEFNAGWIVRGVAGPLPSAESAAMPALPDAPPSGFTATAPAAPAAPGALALGLQTNVAAAGTAAIAELARGLDHDWIRCYHFVRDNVAYASYWGIMRGPERTLLDLEGNDADQAFLLLALLRASGHAGATIAYEPVAESGGYIERGFYLPLRDAAGQYPYNAASWLGVTHAGDDLATRRQVEGKLLSAGRPARFFSAGSVPCVATDHFWVLLPLDGYVYYLDPSVKPTAATAGRDAAADMAYSRPALLAAAGGTVSATSAAGLDAASLGTALDALCAGLRASWTNANADASAYLATRTPVQQTDASLFHGYLVGSRPYDFLSLPDHIVNGLRAAVDIMHGESLYQSIYLDEIGSRRLWISYADDPPRAFPKAVLRLDDTPIAAEPEGAADDTDFLVVNISHGTTPAYTYYAVKRAATNVYALIVGFGGSRPGGMLANATEALAGHLAPGAPADSPAAVSRAMHLAGQQWIAQTDMAMHFRDRLCGNDSRHAYCVGMAGYSGAPFLDIRGSASLGSTNDPALDPAMLFASALEHAVLDQLNGPAAPSVSTVKLLELANASGNPVHFADSNNYAAVAASLVNYAPGQFDIFQDAVSRGRTLLLPQDARISLNDWSGHGYIDHGATPSGFHSTSMVISGGMNGGFGSVAGAGLDPRAYAEKTAPTTTRANPAVRPTIQADPVAMPAGAYLDAAADLLLNAGAPLAWTRRYDSRTRHAQGDLGRGWSHGFEASVSEIADPGAVFGHGSVEAAIPTVVAMTVMRDLLSAPPPPSAGESARRWMTAALTAQWWTRRLNGATVSVNAGAQSLRFQKTPDGSYAPYPGVTAALSKTNGCYTLTGRHGPACAFDPAGRLASVTDRSGNATVLCYDGDGALACVSNAFGASLHISRDAGRISGVTDSAGRSVAYAYSADGCLTSVTDAAGNVWAADYDPATFALLSKTDPGGRVLLRNAYNAFGQVTNQISPAGGTWTFGYAAAAETWDDDPLGGRLTHRYDKDGRLLQRIARDGAVTDWLYDGHGHAVAAMDANGRIDTFHYDGADNLIGTTEGTGALQRVTAFAYDALHRPAAVTNALGGVTRFAYDTCDRLVLLTLPDGSSVSNAWTAQGLLAAETRRSPGGAPLRRTAWSYSPQGLPVTKTVTGPGLPASGITETFAYTPAGQLLSVTDANGHVTTFAYDARGLLTNAVDAAGHASRRVHDPRGMPAGATDPLGRTTAFTWTPSGQPSSVIRPDGAVSTNRYDACDRLVYAEDTRGAALAYLRDAAGRVLRVTSASGADAFAYDPMGLLLASTNAAGVATRFGYDALYRPVRVTDGLGRDWWTAYDALDRAAATADPRGRSRHYTHDPLGRRTAAVRPSGAVDAFGYDGLGNWTTHTNAEGRVYTVTYDALSRPLAATNAAGEQVFANAYDLAGNLTNRTDGAGNSVRYTYDALDRLVSRSAESVSSAPSVDAFSYDAVGNLLSASNAVARETFSYDVMDRLATAATALSNAVFTAAYARDTGGLVTNLVYAPGKAVTRTYDTDGRLATVSDWAGHTWVFTHDGASKLTSVLSPDGIAATNRYDAAGRLESWSVGTLAGRAITRDAAGLKIREEITAGPHPAPAFVRYATNTFDAADRLIAASVRYGSHTNAAVSETYLYDGNGALTNVQSAIGNEHYGYNPLGQLTSLNLRESVPSVVYSYDPIGNRIISGERLFIPDHADPLKRPLVEADAATGNVLRYYIWGNSRLLGFIDAASGTLTVAHCDEYGSVVALTDEVGNTLHTACYGPNGQDWGATGTNPTPFAWLGGHGVQRVAVSGHLGPLYLTRHRLYSASLQRFLSPDPLGPVGGLNLYAYAEGDPLSYIDPLGLCAEGNYIGRSINQLFMGNYTDDVTWLGTGMQVLTGVFNLDLLADIRDNWYNLTHWSDVSTAQKLIDLIGLLPAIGAVKYADEVGDVIKGGNRAADVARGAKGISVDEALDIASEFVTPDRAIKSIDGKSGVQFLQSYTDDAGRQITKRVGFDINPASPHVRKHGPHLNLQTQIDGVIEKSDPHIPINPNTINKGDF